MLLYHRLDGGRHGLWTYHDPEVCLTAVSCGRDPVALSAHWSSRLFKRNNQQLNWPAYSTATVMKRTLRAFTPRGDYQWFRSRTRSPRTQPLFGHTPKYRNNSHIGAYSLSDCHNRTFSNVILTRAASNIGRQHSWTCQIPTVCRSASTERSTLSSFWLGAELLTTTRVSISTEDWQPPGKSRPTCCSSRFRRTFT